MPPAQDGNILALSALRRRDIVNLPNLLSCVRILLSVPVVYCLSLNTQFYNWLAFGLGAVAAGTDYLDGRLARQSRLANTVGKSLDPLADKILVGAVVVYLAFFRGNLPLWFALFILVKDALILLGGMILLLRRVVVQADKPGKYTVTAVALAFICFVFNLDEVGRWVLAVATAFVLYSSYFYYVKFLTLMQWASSRVLRTVLPALILAAVVILRFVAYLD